MKANDILISVGTVKQTRKKRTKRKQKTAQHQKVEKQHLYIYNYMGTYNNDRDLKLNDITWYY